MISGHAASYSTTMGSVRNLNCLGNVTSCLTSFFFVFPIFWESLKMVHYATQPNPYFVGTIYQGDGIFAKVSWNSIV